MMSGCSMAREYASRLKPNGFYKMPVCAIRDMGSLKDATTTYQMGYSVTIQSKIIKMVLHATNTFLDNVSFILYLPFYVVNP